MKNKKGLEETMKKQAMSLAVVMLISVVSMASQVEVDFEEFALPSKTHWGGTNSGEVGFTSSGVSFPHNSDEWSWNGFVYSNMTDTTTSGFVNQYSAITGGGYSSEHYAIGYFASEWWASGDIISMRITPDLSVEVSGAYFTNTTYAYLAMVNGEGPARAFLEDDYLKLLITGIDTNGQETNTVEFLLGDGLDIVNQWTWVNLSGLGIVAHIEFSIVGSDVGDWGLNTPAYFAMDHLVYTIPEPATVLLLGLGATVMFKKRKA